MFGKCERLLVALTTVILVVSSSSMGASASNPMPTQAVLADRLDGVAEANADERFEDLVGTLKADKVQAQLLSEATPTKDVGKSWEASAHGADVLFPSNASGSVVINTESGATFGLELPGDQRAVGRQTQDGILYEGVALDSSGLVRATTEGGVQALVIQESAAAPNQVDFQFELPANTRLELTPNGGANFVAIHDGRDITIGRLKAPWAYDANGTSVDTFYRVHKNTVSQILVPTNETVYPVVADPSYDWRWSGLYMILSRSETKWLASLSVGAVGAGAATLCFGTTVATAVCVAGVVAIFYVVNSMSRSAIDRRYDRGCKMEVGLLPYVDAAWNC